MNVLNSTDETTQGVKNKQPCKWCFNGEQVDGQEICQSCMDKLAEEFCRYLELKND